MVIMMLMIPKNFLFYWLTSLGYPTLFRLFWLFLSPLSFLVAIILVVMVPCLTVSLVIAVAEQIDEANAIQQDSVHCSDVDRAVWLRLVFVSWLLPYVVVNVFVVIFLVVRWQGTWMRSTQ